eukprot:TRINITY_DN5521_c0_g1_i1.p1 TRINITY_DN5521_c0_g1~~TRINITY_DN5521_c0_g1_i1.p1  ORF type:complete len:227 (+),score=37.49 TRINITY_DN5521_c0_g1_i1:139-819(+)
MVLPRSSVLRGSIRAFTLKRAGTQARASLRSIGQRTYASGHEAKKTSDLPWLIGSIAFTVPAASWLIAQAPETSDHGHGHEDHKAKEEEAEEEPKEESSDSEETKEEDSEESKDDAKDDSSEDSKEESSDDDSGKETPEEDSDDDSAPGSAPKDRKTESKGEKDAKSDVSGAKHPALTDPEKSRKSEGVPATAKIHGTVDSSRSTKGKKGDSPPEEIDNKDDKAND